MKPAVRWRLLLLYTALLWALVIGSGVVAAALPDSWSYSGEEVPPLVILQNSLWTLGPALATAAFAMTSATVAIGLHRRGRADPAPSEDPGEEPGLDADLDSGLGTGFDTGEAVLVEAVPAGRIPDTRWRS